MTDFPRLIEHAFPLKQASLDSVHEKNVRHGHISTLHIWPARRPLAACRAALIATLLPDPSAQPKPDGMSDAQWEEEIRRRRRELCEKIGGRVVKRIEKKKMPNGQTVERVKEETEGGILHWGRETENAETLEWFRQEIRKAYGGRAPKVLDPFAGGGAIPLEAMRLGCEATAVDINPVAWFILKCTLEYPQKLAGQTRPLPEFILHDDAFMTEFFTKAKGYSKAEAAAAIKRLHAGSKKKPKPGAKQADAGLLFSPPGGAEGADKEIQADLAWHVRAWGQWVLARARKELAQYYPTYADFEPIKKDQVAYEHQPMRLVPLKEDGTPDIESLNAEFSQEYLEDKRNPRWVAKPTVAYLWARTVKCKNCRATVPLLKTRWLCKKASKRVLLTMEPSADRTGVVFGIEANVPTRGGNAAQKREHDKRLGAGTMSRAGVKCPCCSTIITMSDISLDGREGRIGEVLYSVVVEGPKGKEYRLPTEHEHHTAHVTDSSLQHIYGKLPVSVPEDRIDPASTRSISCHEYGLNTYASLLTSRQKAFVGTIAGAIRNIDIAGQSDDPWFRGLAAYMAAVLDKCLDYGNTLASWYTQNEQITHLFNRYALPMKWDFAETSPIGGASGSWMSMLASLSRSVGVTSQALADGTKSASVDNRSVLDWSSDHVYDAVVTDPPYYQAVSYADLSDFFYVWLRLIYADRIDSFREALTPKEGEIVQHIRSDKDREDERRKYEDWMAQAFAKVYDLLREGGRFAIVFAHKDPMAWETLAAAIIRAGFTVDASWPIQTEMPNRSRGFGLSALSTSIWLIAQKRSRAARPGWDNRVLEEMRANIAVQLREFWDAGIRGPDFVWAATGPALEAYSKHPVVRKANEPNATMSVGEFLNHVRRMVVDFVVGRVLTGEQGADLAAADRLDEVTAYYLLHRHDFGMDEAPVGACILYATACGLSDAELERSWDILVGAGGGGGAGADDLGEDRDAEGDDGDADRAGGEGGGSKVKLKAWSQRKGRSLGYEAPEGKAVPLIDRIHRLMHLWKDGDLHKVDEYIDEHGLRRNELFKRVVQSLIELSTNSERSLLESISNHIGAKGAVRDRGPELFEVRASQ
ncbi:MAG: DUF1156 domain-containing protein [Phycisphaerales bacterium]|nr:DUF1156 domain-containing protein [Phycisphaerales bacterium]